MATNNGRTLTADEKEEFAYELALGYFDDEGLRVRFGLTPTALETYKDSPEIRQRVTIKTREIDESDQALRIHARKAARVAIADLVKLVGDEDAPAKIRMEAGRQLREYATVTDKAAFDNAGEGPIYIKTNLDLGEANGVYAVTAKEVDDQMSEPNPEDDFSDLLGVT